MMRRSNHDLRSLVRALAMSGLMGCSASPPSERPALTLPTPASSGAAPQAASRAAVPVAIALRALPEKLALDGDVEEWGLDAKTPGVAVGVDRERVVVALSWGQAAPSVLSLALANPAPALPSIGWSQRGGTTHELSAESCEYEQVPLVEAGWSNGERHPPEVQKACLAVLARYERQGDEYRERFVRRLRVEGEAVALVDARGARAAFAGAKTKARGSSAEIELPLSALPELNQAPLSYLLGVAVLGELSEALRAVPRAEHPSYGETPPLAEGWARLELATPVGFGPQPALLAAAFAEPASVMNGGLMAQRSYAPHEPGTIRVVSVPDVAVADGGPAPNVPGAIGAPTAPDRPALSIDEEPLSVPLHSFGEVSVVLSLGSVVTLRGDRVVSETGFSTPDDIYRRGADLHLFLYDPGGYDWAYGFSPPAWRVLAIKPDGSTEEVADEGVDFPGMHDAWDDAPKTFHDPTWLRFGMSGKRKGGPKLVAWKWEPAKARYVVSVTPPQTWP